MLVSVDQSDLAIGEAVPWPVYSKKGTLLLAAGAIIESERVIQRLLSSGAVRFTDAAEKEGARAASRPSPERSPIAALKAIRTELGAVLTALAGGTGERVTDLEPLIDGLQRLVWVNADAALGGVHLDREAPYTEVHPILCGVITELLGRRVGLDDGVRRSVMAAALTANVGMLDLQETLAEQSAPLNDAQQRAVERHPLASAALLEKAGVADPLWLNIVATHHEKLDGSGYPQRLAGEQIPLEARLLSLADIYSAMVLPRRHRDGLHAQQAIRAVFAERGKTVDGALADHLIKELGVYPVGAFVQLTNGEIGVVVKRGTARADRPIVCSLVSPRGGHYESPPRRDTGAKDIYRIRQVVARDIELPIDFQALWGGRQTVGERPAEPSSAA